MASLPPSENERIARAEEQLGARFSDPLLLLEALTHRSFLNEQAGLVTPSNERLEFLGDSALGYVVARYVFERYPDLPEGQLTARRAALIRTSTLAGWARELDLPAVLRLGQGETSAGPVRESILAGSFEAVLAAILLDRDLDAVERFLMPLLTEYADMIIEQSAVQNYKGLLQELVQEREHLTPAYHTLSVEGPDHDSVFTVEVVIGDRTLGRGAGRSKQAAQQEAARDALSALERQAEEQP